MALSSSKLPAINGLALCAGYGGLELGLHIAEPRYRTVCFVEREAHAAAALVARMDDQALDRAPIWDDAKSFDGRPWRGHVHLVSGGYPCQPFSVAGQQKGFADPRNLWPHFARIIDEIRPQACFFENVAGHLEVGFAHVAGELRELGYSAKAGLFAAVEAGASHERARLFVLAHADGVQLREPSNCRDLNQRAEVRQQRSEALAGRNADLSAARRDLLDPDVDAASGSELETHQQAGAAEELLLFAPGPGDLDTWNRCLRRDPELQPALCGLADGMADRLDRQRGAGNGVCSLAAAYAYRTLSAAFGQR